MFRANIGLNATNMQLGETGLGGTPYLKICESHRIDIYTSIGKYLK